jgi:hypothetical protein
VGEDEDGLPVGWNGSCNTDCQETSELARDTYLNDTDNDTVINDNDSDDDGDGYPDVWATSTALLVLLMGLVLLARRNNLRQKPGN